MSAAMPVDHGSADRGAWTASRPRKSVSVERLKMARTYFRNNPEGRLGTGLWDEPEWTREKFQAWFRRCLHAKINRLEFQGKIFGGALRKLAPDYQAALRRDARVINDAARGVRIAGRNILSIPELRRRYPEINNYRPE